MDRRGKEGLRVRWSVEIPNNTNPDPDYSLIVASTSCIPLLHARMNGRSNRYNIRGGQNIPPSIRKTIPKH